MYFANKTGEGPEKCCEVLLNYVLCHLEDLKRGYNLVTLEISCEIETCKNEHYLTVTFRTWVLECKPNVCEGGHYGEKEMTYFQTYQSGLRRQLNLKLQQN